MGKGKRIREERAAEREAQRESMIKKAKKDRAKKVWTIVVSSVLIVGLLGGVWYHVISSAAYTSGIIQRNTVVLQTANYKVDAAMLTYYFNNELNNMVNSNSSVLSSIGLDTTKSLKSQSCPYYSDGGTWYDYFSDAAASAAKSNLYLAEKAYEEGITLDEADKATVQSYIDQYYAYADENDLSRKEILALMFGRGVKEIDVRNCLELSTLASKFVRTWQDALDYTDDEINAYYDENKDSFIMVDYLSYTVKATDTANEDTYADAKKQADELAAVRGADAFKNWVEDTYRASTPVTEEFTQADQDEGAKEELDAIEYTNMSEGMIGSTDVSDWLFDEAKVGETYILDDEKGSYTVYLCTQEVHRDESLTHTVRQIFLSDETYGEDGETKEKANSVLAEMKKAGLKDETFATYALEYSEDTNTSAIGGLCENYADADLMEEVAEWVEADARKEGDFEAIAVDGGYVLCYYVGEGVQAWKADCIAAMESEDYSKAYEGWQKDITLTENEKGYDKISSLL